MDPERPILIADDDEDDLFFTTRALRKAGVLAPILTCANGVETVALLREHLKGPRAGLPRAIFLDFKMPQMSGFETLKWIRSQERLADVSVIMLSGSKEVRDTQLAESLGADGYLVKCPTYEAIARAAAIAREAPARR